MYEDNGFPPTDSGIVWEKFRDYLLAADDMRKGEPQGDHSYESWIAAATLNEWQDALPSDLPGLLDGMGYIVDQGDIGLITFSAAREYFVRCLRY